MNAISMPVDKENERIGRAAKKVHSFSEFKSSHFPQFFGKSFGPKTRI